MDDSPHGRDRSLAEREQRLIDAVVSLARSLRDERERLARRLAEVEHELRVLAGKVEVEAEGASTTGAVRAARWSARGG